MSDVIPLLTAKEPDVVSHGDSDPIDHQFSDHVTIQFLHHLTKKGA